MKWNDYKKQAKERGALALELFVIQSIPAKTPEDLKASLLAHLAYQAEQESKGTLAFSGPMSDETGEEMQGMGLIIYRADSMETARLLAEADPMHQSGARRFTLRRWMINEGSINLNVALSTKEIVLS